MHWFFRKRCRFMKTKKRWLLVVILALLIGSAFWYFALGLDYKEALIPKTSDAPTQIEEKDPPAEKEEVPKEEDPGEVMGGSESTIYLLLLGIDESEEREIGIYRSDIMVLASLNLETNQVKMLSIPRDTYAYLPVYGKNDKIGHAYAYGSREERGPQASVEAVEEFLNHAPIQFYFAIKMDPVPVIVDALGGIDLDVEVDMYDPDHDITLNRGRQVLNGAQALLYLQWRNSPGGDLARIRRVQYFLSSLYGQLKDQGKMVEAMSLLLRQKEGIETNLTPKQMLALAVYLKQLPQGRITYYTLQGHSEMILRRSVWIAENNEALLEEYFKNQSLKDLVGGDTP